MKGQDVLVLLKGLQAVTLEAMLRAERDKPYRKLAGELGMSASEVLASERRLQAAGLMDAERQPRPSPAREFILHGLKYVFPARLGGESLGMATGRYAPVLRTSIDSLLRGSRQALPWVWPWPQGDVRGLSVEPLYRSVPVAASRDERLYSWLAVIDCLRLGRARERRFAEAWISKRLSQ